MRGEQCLTKPLPFTEALIRRAVSGVRSAGLRISAVEVRPDGTVVVRSGDDATAALSYTKTVSNTAAASSGWEDEEV